MHRSPVEAEAAEVVEDVNRSPIVEAEAEALEVEAEATVEDGCTQFTRRDVKLVRVISAL